MPKRTYTQEEAAEVFRQAAEIQRSEGEPSEATLTLAELQRIGAEAGLDPAHVVRAAAGEATHRPAALGAPRGIRMTRYVDGPVAEEAWGALVSDLRRTFETPGTMEHAGGLRSWSGTSDGTYPVQAVLEPEETGQRVTVEFSYAGWPQLVVVLGAIAAVVSVLYWSAYVAGAPDEWLPTIIGVLNPIGAALALGLVWYSQREVRNLERSVSAALNRFTSAAEVNGVADAVPTALLDAAFLNSDEPVAEDPTNTRRGVRS